MNNDLPPDDTRDALIQQIMDLKDQAEQGNISAAMFRVTLEDGSVKWVSAGFDDERPEAVQSIKDALTDIADGVERPKNSLS